MRLTETNCLHRPWPSRLRHYKLGHRNNSMFSYIQNEASSISWPALRSLCVFVLYSLARLLIFNFVSNYPKNFLVTTTREMHPLSTACYGT